LTEFQLFPDAMIPENILQEGFGVDEVGAEDFLTLSLFRLFSKKRSLA